MASSVTVSQAQTRAGPLSLQDSFPLGSDAGVLCRVQNSSNDPALKNIFDRSWSIVCRDAARPVGQLYALHNSTSDNAADRLATLRGADTKCGAETQQIVEGLGNVAVSACTLTDSSVGYKVYRYRGGRFTWFAQGLEGYDSALQLGLRSIIADKVVPGTISVAITGISDPTAFARVQAGTLDPKLALAEGYRRNNSGDYAQAGEFFDTLQQRLNSSQTGADSEIGTANMNEYIINRALQKSNLGDFAEADALFAQANNIPTVDRVQIRLRRNFMALNLLNQQKYDEALTVLNTQVVPLGTIGAAADQTVELGPQISAEINSAGGIAKTLGISNDTTLTPEERATILDAQATELRGTILRIQGKPVEARALLLDALKSAGAVRDGRLTSLTRLKSQIFADIGLCYEAEGNYTAAEENLRASLALLSTNYPETSVVNGARARLASYFMRRGQNDTALAMYREVVKSTTNNNNSTTGLSNQLAPYFELLTKLIPAQPALVDDLFLATQTLIRPGVADTQAILSRELQSGNTEASRLFRQAITLQRDVERTRIELARLSNIPNPDAATSQLVKTQQETLKKLDNQQALTQASLAGFSQYRALSTQAMTLADLRATLKPGEAYYKLSAVGRELYAIYIDANGATGYHLPITTPALTDKVTALRQTIAVEENGQNVTYPFDVVLARSLFLDLFAPIADRMATADGLVFEPDGAMLQLPPNLLITEQAGVDAYLARNKDPNADPFDFSGVEWLGRKHAVSTAVSAKSFRDARQTPPSTASKQYIGFGHNAPIDATAQFAATSRSISGEGAIDCNWPENQWNKPISASELFSTAEGLGEPRTDVITGVDFSDTAIRGRKDLNNFRILHFATHGLVTAPRPECPARPALLTSFGDKDSDGLLTFSEIYDLRLNADLVILSACDTAGKASQAATREAGVTTGGGSALDGLVRAFIGAGGRVVIASHWPAPDDFHATERLIAGLFEYGKGDSIANAMRKAELNLMNAPETSHPFYWSGFAIIGDGAQQMLKKQ